MKNIFLTIIIISSFFNISFGQDIVNYDLECLETPYNIEIIYHNERIFCESGITSIDTLGAVCKDLYYQEGIGLWTLNYTDNTSANFPMFFDEVNIVKEEFLGKITKVIEMKKSLIHFTLPSDKTVKTVSFDLVDLNNEGINFIHNYGGWLANYYDSIEDMVAAEENVTRVGNRIHIQNDSITEFHIGGDHIKVANIVFNEVIETTTSTEDFEILDVNIFPNPVQEVLSINCKSNVIKSIQIFDILGKLVFQTNENNTIQEINMTNWDNGIYWLKILNDENQFYSQKIIKH